MPALADFVTPPTFDLPPFSPLTGVAPIVIRRSERVDPAPPLARWQRASAVPVFVIACLFWTALFCAVLS